MNKLSGENDPLISFVSKLASQPKSKNKLIDGTKANVTNPSTKKRIRRTDIVSPESEFTTLNNSSSKGLNVESLLQGTSMGGVTSSDKVFQEASVDKPRASSVLEERVLRKSAYSERAKELDKWTQSIKVNRNAETLDLRDKSKSANLSSASMVHKFTPTTDMEKEITRLLEGSGGTDERKLVEKEEEEMERNGLTEEQVKKRQYELQKMRNLLFYEQQKRKRISKIKSKSYHRIRNRQNRRLEEQELKGIDGGEEEDDLIDPMKKAEKEEKEELKRMQERMSLKHKNTSKWAKEQLKMGKTDVSTRKAMAEQLRMGEELLRKATRPDNNNDSDDDDSDDSENEEIKARNDANSILFNTNNETSGSEKNKNGLLLTNDISSSSSSSNPQKGIMGMKFMQRAIQKHKETARKEAEEMLKNLNNEELLEFSDNDEPIINATDDDKNDENDEEEDGPSSSNVKKLSRKGSTLETNSMEVGLLSRSNKSVKVDGVLEVANMKKKKDKISDKNNNDDDDDSNPWLEAVDNSKTSARKSKRKRGGDKTAIVEMNQATTEMYADSSTAASQVLLLSSSTTTTPKKIKKDKNDENHTQTNVVEENEEEEVGEKDKDNKKNICEPTQAELIARAFASPDFEQEFINEKEQLNKDKKKEEDIKESDGWGSWAGVGVENLPKLKTKHAIQNKNKSINNQKVYNQSISSNKKFKKSNDMPLVLISDKRIKKASKLKLEEVPYPFTSREQYERSLAVPIGKEWNAMRAVRGFARPQVITNAGEVITPVKLAKKKSTK